MADFGHPFQQPADFSNPLKQSNSKEAQRRQEKGLVRASGGKLRRLRLLVGKRQISNSIQQEFLVDSGGNDGGGLASLGNPLAHCFIACPVPEESPPEPNETEN
ncbi:hypothetical protein RUM44_009921 [Polyplax serrata]|uniref:Uncharacterized protein n=1 Tax=Polyplax serrata TaxID=468196 RepID=A0ABR1AU29_POLSC